jgi:hypothetical protein
VQHLEPAAALEHFARHARRRRAGTERQLARIGFAVGDEVGNGRGGHGGVHGERERDVAQSRYRLEIGDRIVGELLEQVRVGRMRRVAGDEHRVAIGRGARDVRGRGLAAGAGDVLDDDGPAERRVELLAENAGERIGGASGGERHHEPDGARRIFLGRRGRGEQRERAGGQLRDRPGHDLHAFLPVLPRVEPAVRFP